MRPAREDFGFDCTHDLRSLALTLLDYVAYTVDSDPQATGRLEQYLAVSMLPLRCDSQPLLVFDVAVINGAALTDLQSEARLVQVCEQISAILSQDGLLLITGADYDRLLSAKERVSKPHITEDTAGRRYAEIILASKRAGFADIERYGRVSDQEIVVARQRGSR